MNAYLLVEVSAWAFVAMLHEDVWGEGRTLLQAVKRSPKGRKAESRQDDKSAPSGRGRVQILAGRQQCHVNSAGEESGKRAARLVPCVDPGSCQEYSWQDVWLMAGEKF